MNIKNSSGPWALCQLIYPGNNFYSFTCVERSQKLEQNDGSVEQKKNELELLYLLFLYCIYDFSTNMCKIIFDNKSRDSWEHLKLPSL